MHFIFIFILNIVYLSICGIQTNVAVNCEQALMFMESFNETASQCSNVQQFLKNQYIYITIIINCIIFIFL